MKRRNRRQEPETTPEAVIEAAKAAFETAAPGIGVCGKCWQPADSRTHRKQCGG